MSRLTWYWHRLRAMSAAEMALHARKKLRQRRDARSLPDWPVVDPALTNAYPQLPDPAQAPEALRQALARDAGDILAGRWKAFGHLDLQVDDPPRWHRDYLAGKDFNTGECAFRLDHRALPGGDIKLIWELSRWHALTRLAMAAHVLGHERAATKCLDWIEDWTRHNPPWRGWNWTSALEAGMRLIQFTWIDALLGAPASGPARMGKETSAVPVAGAPVLGEGARNSIEARLAALRSAILPPHVWFTWRYQSFGSSANNHLLGELAGLICAVARWPALARWAAPLDALQSCWEREVLAQFAGDGGNREQALNYQLFSWELCWHARTALAASGRAIAEIVEQRFTCAARFFCEIQARKEPWDYGDSDNAFVLPLFANEATVVQEWHHWMESWKGSVVIPYWVGELPSAQTLPKRETRYRKQEINGWWLYPHTCIAICESGLWWLRWDLSRLGYLATAAHGHLDALHLSVWFKGMALIIDPGTGAYYADKELRTWLASRSAHNCPSPVSAEEWPRRLGPFLWAENHNRVPYAGDDKNGLWAVIWFPTGTIQRSVGVAQEGKAIEVIDSIGGGQPGEFSVRWQFAPGSTLKRRGEREFILRRQGVEIGIQVSGDWAEVNLVESAEERDRIEPQHPLAGVVSPAFRKTVWAPYLRLVARPEGPCVFRTTFLASPGA
jgi:hypothetical protein